MCYFIFSYFCSALGPFFQQIIANMVIFVNSGKYLVARRTYLCVSQR